MAKIFKHKNKGQGYQGPKSHQPRKTEENVELMDPVLYVGDLDEKKYPILPNQKEVKEEEDVENPLNRR